jgi:2-aminoethylphosphonate transport system ATP-binding protein
LGRANLLPVVVEGEVRKEGMVAVRAGDDRLVVASDGAPSGARRLLCVRPQHLTLAPEHGYSNRICGRVREVLWQGELTHLVAEVGDTVMRIVATRLPSLPERGAPLDLFFAPADASLIPEEAGV